MQTQQREEHEGVCKKTKPSGISAERLHLKKVGVTGPKTNLATGMLPKNCTT